MMRTKIQVGLHKSHELSVPLNKHLKFFIKDVLFYAI